MWTPRPAVAVLAALLCLPLLATPAAAVGGPDGTLAFTPGTIAAGNVARATLTLTNGQPGPLVDQAAQLDLPAGVALADPPSATTSCVGAVVSAPGGGGTATVSGIRLGTGASCTVAVDVTSSTPGSHGATGTGGASATLTVATDRPTVILDLAPDTLAQGRDTTLTVTVDNSTNGSFGQLAGTLPLPDGLVVADLPAFAHDCMSGPSTTPDVGDTALSLNNLLVNGNAVCTLTVDLTAAGVAAGPLRSDPLQSVFGGIRDIGRAVAAFDVEPRPFRVAVANNPVAPGGVVELAYTVQNTTGSPLTDITFSDDLATALGGATIAAQLPTAPCGAGSSVSGAGVLVLSGGNLPYPGSCTFAVAVQLPGGGSPGDRITTTSSTLHATATGGTDADGRGDGAGPVTMDPASDVVVLGHVPDLDMAFLSDPVVGGEQVTVRFTVTNPDPANAMTALSFGAEVTRWLDGATVVTLPAANSCGSGSSFGIAFPETDRLQVRTTNASLAAGASCTVDVVLRAPDDARPGESILVVEDLVATLTGEQVRGADARATATVLARPRATVSVLEDPVIAGGTAVVSLRLTQPGTPDVDPAATAVSGEIPLTGLPGLVATGLPLTDVCGTGGQLTGTAGDTVLHLSGVTLEAGGSCTVQVPVTVPGAADTGAYTIIPTSLDATVDGIPVTGLLAGDALDVSGVVLSVTHPDQPAIPGGTTTVRYTLSNVAGRDATAIALTHDLDQVVAGLVPSDASTRADVCGAGSSLQFLSTGGRLATLTGGFLPAGGQCTFDVELSVPGGAADGEHHSTTSTVTYDDGTARTAPAQQAVLAIDGQPLLLQTTFTGQPVRQGDTVTQVLTLTNTNPARTVDGIGLTVDLGAALPGLAAVDLPATDVCGAGSTLTGSSVLTLSGATLAPDASCAVTVTLQLPAVGLDQGASVEVTTSAISGTAQPDAVPVGGPATGATLVVAGDVGLSRVAAGVGHPGETVDLTYTITTDDPVNGVTGLRLADDLGWTIPRLTRIGTAPSQPCGPGSTLTGTGVVTLQGASLGAAEACTFTVTVRLPDDAPVGTHQVPPVQLQADSAVVATMSGPDLRVDPQPDVVLAVAPTSVLQRGVATMTWTVDNTHGTVPASSITLAAPLVGGLTVADPPAASTTCTGGTLTATAGASTVSLTGAAVGAGATCTVQVDVVATDGGTVTQPSGTVTSTAGTSPTTTAELVVATAPRLTKAFAAEAVLPRTPTTLVLTIDNTVNGGAVAITDLTDPLPAGMVVAADPSVAHTCPTGTVTAVPGAATIGFVGTAPAAGTCQVDVDVTTTGDGTRVNTTALMVTAKGTADAASATLRTVTPMSPRLGADLAVLGQAPQAVPGEPVDVTFTVANAGPAPTAGQLSVAVPSGVELVGFAGCAADVAGCALPTIIEGGTVTVTATVVLAEAGAVDISATVTGEEEDPEPADNRTTVEVVAVRPVTGEDPRDVIDNAVAVSRERFPSTRSGATRQAGFVVLARVDVFADALTGSVLTGDAPLLFTDAAALDPDTDAEILRVLGGPGTVYLLGGEAALSPAVSAALAGQGHTVVRLAGPSRVETALAVAEEARRLYGPQRVALARAGGTDGNPTAAWADSVTAGGWAAATGSPILLTPSDALHPAVGEWMATAAVTDVVVLGGTAAIADQVVAGLGEVTRVAGAERGGTAVAVARTLRGVSPGAGRSYLLVNGFAEVGWTYGLVAAGLSADRGAPVLLTDAEGAPPSTVAEVTGCVDQPVQLRRVVPAALLGDGLLAQLDALDGGTCAEGVVDQDQPPE